MKRLVVISDLHCGHRSALTPPDWQREYRNADKYARVRERLWTFYAETLAALQPIDCLVVNGDAIDGKGERSGGTELIEADRTEQAKMAAACIREARAKKIYIIAGTPYHTGREDDFEAVVAELVNADHFGNHEWVDCDGVMFDFKHKVGGSSIPHGRYTAIQRAALWNTIWADRLIQPRAMVVVRSHVHYFGYSGDVNRLCLSTPGFQAWTKFGSKECEGTNDIGLVSFDCDKGRYSWEPHILDMQWAKVRPFKV